MPHWTLPQSASELQGTSLCRCGLHRRRSSQNIRGALRGCPSCQYDSHICVCSCDLRPDAFHHENKSAWALHQIEQDLSQNGSGNHNHEERTEDYLFFTFVYIYIYIYIFVYTYMLPAAPIPQCILGPAPRYVHVPKYG